MKIETERQNEILLVKVIGSLNTQTAPDLEGVLKESLDVATSKVIFDFSNLDYISSAGLRILLLTTKKIKDGKVIIKTPKPEVLEVLNMTGFTSFLEIE